MENFWQSSAISNKLKFVILGPGQEGEFVLAESDLVRLRTPIIRLQDHLMAVGLMQEEMKRLNEYIENYLLEVKSEQKRISKMVENLQ